MPIHRRLSMPVLAGTLLLAACGTIESPDTVTNTAAELNNLAKNAADQTANASDTLANTLTSSDPAQWVGRWTGPEGLYMEIQPDPARGEAAYSVEMQYTLDDQATFDGDATSSGIRITRPDGTFLITATDGEATGMKWLAEKQNCLTVTAGEGYCRD